MKYMHRNLSLTIILSLFISSMPVHSAQQTEHEIYFNHLKYEYGNRARTYIGMEAAARASMHSERGPFFQAYYEMERLNQLIYGHMKEELGVDYEVSWFVGKGLQLIGYIGWRFLDTQWFVDIVIPYLPKLEEMKALSDPKHHIFFDYVLVQEQAQLDASLAVLEGSWQDGADILQAVIPQGQATLDQLNSTSDKAKQQ